MQAKISGAEGGKGPEELAASQRLARRKNILLIIFGVFLALILFSSAAIFVGTKLGFIPSLLGGFFGDQVSAEEVKDPAFMYEVPEILINLPEGGRRFLSVKFYLGFDEPKLEAELDKRMPEIRDEINKILWSKTAEELNTLEGKEDLRKELLKKIDCLLKDGELRGLYFWHVLVQ
ncbi:MAG: hypothetical protein GX989_03335 [Firmicutes bacterium]|nr:hypothetical protein [Bacillota bacterium]